MRLFQSFGEMPRGKRFGSKVGWLTSARISPVFGSMATTAPARVPSASSAASCTFRSMVRYRSVPGFGSSIPRSFTFRPDELIWIIRRPEAPRRSAS
ncbi:MAG: hypothetical protein A2X57_03590 [Nitrospirae bacterium GWD2_57_8]|nr:MAG: hypothetical protein A2X57_03590 [Nitrospirae bacterium GWD2_57_8]